MLAYGRYMNLHELSQSVEAAEREAASKLITDALMDSAFVTALREGYSKEPAPIEGLLAAMASKRGLRDVVGSLRRMIRVKPELRMAGPGEQAPDLAQALGWDIAPGIRAGTGYEVRTSGVWHGDRQITARPILIAGRLLDVESGAVHVRVGWGTDSPTWRVVPRRTVADSRSIVALSDEDAPVHSGNAADVVAYLARQEAVSRSAIPSSLVSSHLGWQGKVGEIGYLWGRVLLKSSDDSEDVKLHLDDGLGELADACVSHGTWEGWLSQVAIPCLAYPSVMLSIYASIVPALLPLLAGAPNFVVDWSGMSSTGKTTLLRVAGSVWGNPDEKAGGVVRSWDSTRVWIERAACACSGGIPVILDDTKRAKPELVGKTIYDIASGIGKGRGSVEGTRSVSRWRTVLLSTGETPAISYSQDGGVRARALSLWGSPWGEASELTAADVRRVSEGVLDHYGFLGPQVIKLLLKPGAKETAQKAYKLALVHWSAQAGAQQVLGRAAHYVALLQVARDIIHGPIGIPWPKVDALPLAWVAAQDAAREADRPADALRLVLSWAAGRQGQFDRRHPGDSTKADQPAGGWLGAWTGGDTWRTIAVLPHELAKVLQGAGYDVEACLASWWDRGWLDEGEKRSEEAKSVRRTKKARVGDRSQRCTVIKRAARDAIDGEDEVMT